MKKIILPFILSCGIAYNSFAQYNTQQIINYLNDQPIKVIYWHDLDKSEFLPLKRTVVFDKDSSISDYFVASTMLQSFHESFMDTSIFYYVPSKEFKDLKLTRPNKKSIDYLETDVPFSSSYSLAKTVEDSISKFGDQLSTVISFRIENEYFWKDSFPAYVIMDGVLLAGSYYSFRRSGRSLKGVGYFSLGVLLSATFGVITHNLINGLIKAERRKKIIQSFDSKIEKY